MIQEKDSNKEITEAGLVSEIRENWDGINKDRTVLLFRGVSDE